MLLESIKESFEFCVKKPLVFVPAVILMLVSIALYDLTTNIMTQVLFRLSTVDVIPNVSVFQFPYFMYSIISDQVGIWIGIILLMALINVIVLYWTVRYVMSAKTKTGNIMNALQTALKSIANMIILFIFLAVIAIALLEVGLFFVWLSQYLSFIGVIILFLYMLLIVYLLVHFMLIVPAMAVKQCNTGKALREAWEFGNEHWGGILLMLIFLAVINAVLNTVLNLAFGVFGAGSLMIALSAIFSLFFLTYSNVLFGVYYLKGKEILKGALMREEPVEKIEKPKAKTKAKK